MKDNYDIHITINKQALQTQVSLAIGIVLILLFAKGKAITTVAIFAIVLDLISVLYTMFNKGTKPEEVEDPVVEQKKPTINEESTVHKRPKPLESAEPITELPTTECDWDAFFNDN